MLLVFIVLYVSHSNEWYAKDTSKKIRTVFQARMKEGKRCSGSVPYGFYRKPGDKQTLYVDEEAANVVRRIFQLACEGIGVTQIAETLSTDKVLVPAAYAREFHPEDCQNKSYNDPYAWSSNTVSDILDRQEYLGHTVLGKTVLESFKTKKRRKATQDELLIFPDTHEAIIDQETWDKAQRLRKRQAPRRPNGKVYDSDENFRCSNYKNRYHSCTPHFIKVSVLEELLLQATQRVVRYVMNDEKEFLAQLQAQYQQQQEQDTAAGRKELLGAQRRMQELDDLIRSLYENYAAGRLPERQYTRLMTEYDSEQEALEQRIAELESADDESVSTVQPERFIRLIKKYSDFSELTTPMLYDLIEKVVVHEATGKRGDARTQQVEIYFNFIGNFIAPTGDEEIRKAAEAAAAAEEEKMRKKQESARRQRERKKQKRAELKAAAEAGDPKAQAEYQALLEKQREQNRKSAERKKALKMADPEYIANWLSPLLSQRRSEHSDSQVVIEVGKVPPIETITKLIQVI